MVKRHEPWNADEMDSIAESLDWAQKHTLKPAGSFDEDYKALCGLFEIPAHPSLLKRQPKERLDEDGAAAANSSATSKNKSCIQVRNFAVDRVTLMAMLEALKRSSDIDTLIFHNTGLNAASVGLLAEGLPHTTVRSFSLDYSIDAPKVEAIAVGGVGGVVANEQGPKRSSTTLFSSLLEEASKLKALSLRGNGLADGEAVAIAAALEQNTTLCSLNLFDNTITDVGAAAIAESLKLNTVLRGLSLARNRLTATSAETFGLLLAGGYEVSPAEMEKRSAAESAIAAINKIAQDAMKKKRDAKVETRLPLGEVSKTEDGKLIAGGSRSLASLNISDNREVGARGAISKLLSRLEEGRRRAGGASVALQELHLRRCSGFGNGGESEEEDGRAGLIAASCLALRPTIVYT